MRAANVPCFLSTSFDTVVVMEVSHRVFKVRNEGHAPLNSFLRVNNIVVSVVVHSNSLQRSRSTPCVYLMFDQNFVYFDRRLSFPRALLGSSWSPAIAEKLADTIVRNQNQLEDVRTKGYVLDSLTHDFITNVLSPEVKQPYIFCDSWKRRMKMASLSSWFSFFVERMKLKVSSGGHSYVESDRDIDSSWENPSGVLADL